MAKRKTGSHKFGGHLKALMARRGMTQRQTGEVIGVTSAAVSRWVKGDALPSQQAAARLIDHFGSQALATMLADLRGLDCHQCGRRFERSAKRGRFCSRTCWQRWWNQEHVKQRLGDRADLLVSIRNENDDLRYEVQRKDAAVERFCRACEIDGLCKTADCELRDVSPLPLKRARAA